MSGPGWVGGAGVAGARLEDADERKNVDISLFHNNYF
jgi:hypothetical protein